MNYESKAEQYAGYLRAGGTMTLEQWENDGRYDRHLAGPIFAFETDMPERCYTKDQARAVIMCRFQRELDMWLDKHTRRGE